MKKAQSFWTKHHDFSVISRHLVSNYTEVTVFLLFVSLMYAIFDLIANGFFVSLLSNDALLRIEMIEVIIYVIPVLLGGIYSGYYALNFRKAPQKKEQRLRMLAFGVIIEAIAATVLVMQGNLDTWYGMTLFILNAVHIVAVFQLLGTKYLDETNLSRNYNGTPFEVLFGVLVVTIVFYGLRSGYQQGLGVAFASSVIYAGFINNAITRLFVKR